MSRSRSLQVLQMVQNPVLYNLHFLKSLIVTAVMKTDPESVDQLHLPKKNLPQKNPCTSFGGSNPMTGPESDKKLVLRVAPFASWQQIQPTDLIKTRVMPWECWLCEN